VKQIWPEPENIFEIPKRITLTASVADTITRAIASGFLLPNERVKKSLLRYHLSININNLTFYTWCIVRSALVAHFFSPKYAGMAVLNTVFAT
jgi:hypothetical protein